MIKNGNQMSVLESSGTKVDQVRQNDLYLVSYFVENYVDGNPTQVVNDKGYPLPDVQVITHVVNA